MSRKRTMRLAGAVLLATGTASALATPSIATPQAADSDSPRPTVSAEMAEAMQRDLGLTANQAQTRLAQESQARKAEDAVRQSLGNSFGGAFFDAERGKLVVGTTDASEKSAVRSAGAVAKVVPNSQQELNAAKAELDRMEESAPAAVTGWYVDTRSNSVVVNVNKTKRDAETNKFLAQARSVDDSVRVEQVKRSPRPLYDIVGGDAYYMGSGGRCSVGFAVQGGGMVTAGHCGDVGTSASGYNQVAMGTFQGSSFPGNDYAWVSANSNWTSTPRVNGSSSTVAGSQEAPIGSSICRSGSTTGWHCGTVEAKNQTVRYSQGAVYGLTRTDACAEPGDSGGSFISGNQAQGMTSGGSGNCTIGGTTYFQPVNEVLNRYGLQLTTN